MVDGFVRVAALTPRVSLADVDTNVRRARALCMRAVQEIDPQVMVLPELYLSGYTAEDLFWQDELLDAAEQALFEFAALTKEFNALIFVGLPLRAQGKLYNVAAALNRGRVLGLVPKQHIPTYGEFYEGRHFSEGPANITYLEHLRQSPIPFGANQLFCAEGLPNVCVAAEICEDLWVANPPSTAHAQAGATLIVNLSASNELVGKADYRRMLVQSTSARLMCGYVYASAGKGESTTDVVYSNHSLIAENGSLIQESKPFSAAEMCASEIDVAGLAHERLRISSCKAYDTDTYLRIPFELERYALDLTRPIDPHPFVPAGQERRAERCEEILTIQVQGLIQRLEHTHSQTVVVGVSGGLDSTLALLVCARAFEELDLDSHGIIAVTMPGFGTTSRTFDNATQLALNLGADLREIPIADAVNQHFSDIGHDGATHDVTYENSQARERTQILMDVANLERGLVIGTGDLSELALGWATYNGDHMSMYAVNTSVPKTLVRHLVRFVADSSREDVRRILLDVLDTPVSPELLPASEDGTISQVTEDLVGPYELHDFFLYHVLRRGEKPRKIFRLATQAFAGVYDQDVIVHWLKVFYQRFFAQQFKRSCLPDGPKVGSVAVSPRGDLRMPSDALASLWLHEVELLER